MQIKVKETKLHSLIIHQMDTYGGRVSHDSIQHILLVAEGELVLVECKPEEALIAKSKVNNKIWIKTKATEGTPATYYKPIIISKTEKMEEGGLVLLGRNYTTNNAIKVWIRIGASCF